MLVKAKIAKHAAGLMVEDAKFWIVEPRISLSGVSGLNTLLSGNYIGFQAGKSDRRPARRSSASTKPPIITDQRGPAVRAQGARLWDRWASGRRSTIRQACNVGQVAAYNLAPDGRSVEMTVFVDAPYDKFVTPETRFWNASGIDVIGRRRRRGRAHGIAGGAACRRRSPSTRPTSCRKAPPAERTRIIPRCTATETIAMKQPDPDRAALRALFQRIGAGPSAGRAGNAARAACRRGHASRPHTMMPSSTSSVHAC